VTNNQFLPHQFVGVVGVLLGNGDGTFQGPASYATGGFDASSAAIGDVNGDGNPDVVVTNACQNLNQGGNCGGQPGAVAVLFGNGDGTLQFAVSYNTGAYDPTAVAIGDVNGDGNLDLIVSNGCQNPSPCYGQLGALTVLLGNGDGTFQAPVAYSSGGYFPNSIAISDVNGDGKLDVVVANCNGIGIDCANSATVGVLLGNGDGTFQGPVAYDPGGNGAGATSIAVGDVNGDERPDLVVGICPSADQSVCDSV